MFGKNKKPLTEKAKFEKRQHRNQVLKTCLHVFSYICTGLFWLVCLIGLCSGSCSKSGSKLVIAHAYSSNDDYQSVIFYPSDVNTNPGKVKFYLTCHYRNYNLLKYHLPTSQMILNWSGANFTNTKPDTPGITDTYKGQSMLYLYDGVTYDGEYSHDRGLNFTIPGISNVYFTGLRVNHNYDTTYNVNIYRFDLAYHVGLGVSSQEYVTLYRTFDNISQFEPNTDLLINGSYYSMYKIIDYVFGGNVYFLSQWSDAVIPRNLPSTNYYFFTFMAYYYSQYSFDFNGYQFGGASKYLSTSYLFNRVYNGAFIYMPNTHLEVGNDSAIHSVTQKCLAFSGLWEYENTLYSKIYIYLLPARNGGYSYGDNVAFDYTVSYFTGSLDNPSSIDFNIIDASSDTLLDYYFIWSITMYTVDNSKSVTLAYNTVDYTYIGGLPTQSNHLSVNVLLNNDIRLYQTDSFINNNGIYFTVYRIDYDKNFSEYGTNIVPCLSYRYYSDFFFATFVYTGLYNSVSPTSTSNTGTNFFNPVFTIFKNGLSGLIPFLNFEMLPGISFGVLLMMPFAVTLILFVVRLFKR